MIDPDEEVPETHDFDYPDEPPGPAHSGELLYGELVRDSAGRGRHRFRFRRANERDRPGGFDQIPAAGFEYHSLMYYPLRYRLLGPGGSGRAACERAGNILTDENWGHIVRNIKLHFFDDADHAFPPQWRFAVAFHICERGGYDHEPGLQRVTHGRFMTVADFENPLVVNDFLTEGMERKDSRHDFEDRPVEAVEILVHTRGREPDDDKKRAVHDALMRRREQEKEREAKARAEEKEREAKERAEEKERRRRRIHGVDVGDGKDEKDEKDEKERLEAMVQAEVDRAAEEEESSRRRRRAAQREAKRRREEQKREEAEYEERRRTIEAQLSLRQVQAELAVERQQLGLASGSLVVARRFHDAVREREALEQIEEHYDRVRELERREDILRETLGMAPRARPIERLPRPPALPAFEALAPALQPLPPDVATDVELGLEPEEEREEEEEEGPVGYDDHAALEPPRDRRDGDEGDGNGDAGVGHFLAAYDQKAIEAARPFQTLEWYERRAKWLWKIANSDNRCLFYALAIAERLSAYRRAKIEVERCRALKLPPPAAELKRSGNAELKRIKRFAEGFEGRTELKRRARALAAAIAGEDATEFSFEEVVRAHNYLRTLILVFACEDGEVWKLVFRSDQPPPELETEAERLDEFERPVIMLYYTPTADGHVDLIADPGGVAALLGFRNQKFCTICLETYYSVDKHRCAQCYDCGFPACDAIRNKLTLAEREEKGLECADCGLKFNTAGCMERHRRPKPKGRGVIVGQSVDQAREGKHVEVGVLGRRSKRKQPPSHCAVYKWCGTCGCKVRRTELVFNDAVGKPMPREHRCGSVVCAHCKLYVPRAHQCTVQRFVEKKARPRVAVEGKDDAEGKWSPPAQYAFFDCECDCRGVHKPYLIRVHEGLESEYEERMGEGALGGYDGSEFVGERAGDYDRTGRKVKHFFEGWDCVDQFLTWLVDRRKEAGLTFVAHNGSGYDWAILYSKIVVHPGLRGVRPLYRGSSLICINVGRGKSAVRFIDSMLFAAGRLSEYPTTFGIAEQLRAAGFGGNKEFFPHWLYEIAPGHFRTYAGDMPPREAYRPHHMDRKRRAEFDAWYAEEAKKFAPQTERQWVFTEQARDYCDQDVQVLRRAMRVFRQGFMAHSRVDPLQFVTMPAACLAAYRKTFMPQDHIANFSPAVNRILRRAVQGGRTEARQFYWKAGLHEFPATEELRYYDVNSLYPSVMAAYGFPKGHPLYYGDAAWPDEVRVEGPAHVRDLDAFLMQGSLAILCVDVTCPRTLYHPVLGEHEKTASGTKFIFSLTPKTRYWTNSPELRLAIAKGYEVTAVHAVAWWPPRSVTPSVVDEDDARPSMFGAYVRTFMALKDQAGGWPADAATEEQKAEYLARYAAHPLNSGTRLEPDKVAVNPGLKAVAKLQLNNLWGKFTQRENMPMVRLFDGTQAAHFNELMADPDYEVLKVIAIRQGDPEDPLDRSGVVEVVYRRPAEWFDAHASVVLEQRAPEQSTMVYSVPIGVFTTAYARIELYKLLDALDEQVVYCDTDSVVFRYDPANPKHRAPSTGPFLGQLKDECAGKRIAEFFAGGPKNYGYLFEDGRGKSTVKGLPRSALMPRFQALFLRASVISMCLGEAPPAAHVVRFQRLVRNRAAQQVCTDALAFRSYRLVNEKVHLFPDGSTLPLGHVGIPFRQEIYDAQAELWRERLAAASTECAALREEQNEADIEDGRVQRDPPQAMDERPDRDEKDEKDEKVAVRVGGRVQMWPRDRAEARLARERAGAAPVFDGDVEFAFEEHDTEWMMGRLDD